MVTRDKNKNKSVASSSEVAEDLSDKV